MAKSSALTVITRKAKQLKKAFPHKYDHMKKRDRWSKGYIKQASKSYKSGGTTHRKKHTKKVGAKRTRKPVKRTAKPKAHKLVKYVEKSSTERVMSGRKKKRCHCAHRVYMAGARSRRVSGSGGNMGLIIGLGVGALAFYLLSKKTAPAPTTPLPPIVQTSNPTRNSQSQDIINYAVAAGVAINSIYSLIDRLNSSSDSDVSNIYDSINTTGDVSAWV